MIQYLLCLLITNTHMAFCNRLLEINGKLSTLRMFVATKLRYEVDCCFCLKFLLTALLAVLCLRAVIFRKISWELVLPVLFGIEVICWLILIHFPAWAFSYGSQFFQFALFRVLTMCIFYFLIFCFNNRRFPYKKRFVFSMYFVSWIYCTVFCNIFS